MALEVNKFNFSLVGETTGDSPVFGAQKTYSDPVPHMNNWHWTVDISTLPTYAWTVLVSSVIMQSDGPADYWPPSFTSQPNINYMSRSWEINGDGTYPSRWEIPLDVAFSDPAVTDIDGPWRLSTNGSMFNPGDTAYYYLTEFLSGGDPGFAFQWAEDNWLSKISMPGQAVGSNLTRDGSTDCYFPAKVNTVDYFFSAGNTGRNLSGGPFYPVVWTQLDARLIVIGCPGNELYLSIV
jgi:hypothetical protein